MLARLRRHWPIPLLVAALALLVLSSFELRIGRRPPAPQAVPRLTRGLCTLYYSTGPAEAAKAADVLGRHGWADGRRHDAGLRREAGGYRLSVPVTPEAAADPAVLADAREVARELEAAGLAPAEVHLTDPDGKVMAAVTPE
jgi:hypothetical protein